MSDVTFTPEQIREIRRRIEDAYSHKQDILAAFPLPKVTRYRTFTNNFVKYRVCGDTVECEIGDGRWEKTLNTAFQLETGSISGFGAWLVKNGHWTALAAFADVCARPVEEVDA